MANIGFRPTVRAEDSQAPQAPLIEVHLLDFEGDLYGASLEVEFVRALRGEQRFEGAEALVEQIERDVSEARKILGSGSD